MDVETSIDLGAVLAGGRARRMGGRKADLEIGGMTLVERSYRRISPLCRETVCVGGEDFLKSLGVKTLPDLFPGADSMGAIATALFYALNEYGPESWVLAVGCDMPLISPELVMLLAGKRVGRDVVVPKTAPGFEPLCALYRAGIYPVLETLIFQGNLRLRDVFFRVNAQIVEEDELRLADPGLLSFANVNRKEDLPAIVKILEGTS